MEKVEKKYQELKNLDLKFIKYISNKLYSKNKEYFQKKEEYENLKKNYKEKTKSLKE